MQFCRGLLQPISMALVTNAYDILTFFKSRYKLCIYNIRFCANGENHLMQLQDHTVGNPHTRHNTMTTVQRAREHRPDKTSKI